MERRCLKCRHLNPAADGTDTEACPNCGGIYSKIEAYVAEHGDASTRARVREEQEDAEALAAANASPSPAVQRGMQFVAKWVFLGMFFLLVGWVTQKCHSDSGSPPSKDSSHALVLCQRAIELASRNSSAAKVPYVPESGLSTSGQHVFEWRYGSGLLLQNGFGAMLNSTATCAVSTADYKLDELTIDGITVYRR